MSMLLHKARAETLVTCAEAPVVFLFMAYATNVINPSLHRSADSFSILLDDFSYLYSGS